MADTRDWTTVIDEGCGECGYRPHDPADTGARVRGSLVGWEAALSHPDAQRRPEPSVWSPVEYGCHVRDVCRIFRGRLELMMGHDDPTFPDWDGEAAATEGDYGGQYPSTAFHELAAEAELTAAAFDAVSSGQWDRGGRRGDGRAFTPATLARYFLHEVEHHLRDAARP